MHGLPLSRSVQYTFLNLSWMSSRTGAIKLLLPAKWTQLAKKDFIEIAQNFRSLGWDFVEDIEIVDAFNSLEKMGLLLRRKDWFKVNDRWEPIMVSHCNFNEVSRAIH